LEGLPGINKLSPPAFYCLEAGRRAGISRRTAATSLAASLLRGCDGRRGPPFLLCAERAVGGQGNVGDTASIRNGLEPSFRVEAISAGSGNHYQFWWYGPAEQRGAEANGV